MIIELGSSLGLVLATLNNHSRKPLKVSEKPLHNFLEQPCLNRRQMSWISFWMVFPQQKSTTLWTRHIQTMTDTTKAPLTF